jgi:hypothetical protein
MMPSTVAIIDISLISSTSTIIDISLFSFLKFQKLFHLLQGVVVDDKQETKKECRFTSNPDSAQQL